MCLLFLWQWGRICVCLPAWNTWQSCVVPLDGLPPLGWTPCQRCVTLHRCLGLWHPKQVVIIIIIYYYYYPWCPCPRGPSPRWHHCQTVLQHLMTHVLINRGCQNYSKSQLHITSCSISSSAQARCRRRISADCEITRTTDATSPAYDLPPAIDKRLLKNIT